jgi:hypothetical protein
MAKISNMLQKTKLKKPIRELRQLSLQLVMMEMEELL